MVSKDGTNFEKAAQSSGQPASDGVIKTVDIALNETEARYIKLMIERYGIIPEGKQGAGHEAWLFIDEIRIN